MEKLRFSSFKLNEFNDRKIQFLVWSLGASICYFRSRVYVCLRIFRTFTDTTRRTRFSLSTISCLNCDTAPTTLIILFGLSRVSRRTPTGFIRASTPMVSIIDELIETQKRMLLLTRCC